jgi:hypothetical protein
LWFYDGDEWGHDVDDFSAEAAVDWGELFRRHFGWWLSCHSLVGQKAWGQGCCFGVETDAGRRTFGVDGCGEPGGKRMAG